MRNTITVVFVALAGVALAAQQTSSSQAGSASNSGQQKGPVTVTGCLEAGPNNTFTLSAPDTKSGGATGTSGSTEATGTTATTPAGSKVVKTVTYTLTPAGNVDLKSHVGHKVQVTGSETPAEGIAQTHDTRQSTAAPQGTSGKTPTVQTTTQTQIVARQLSVSSVKPVSDKCDILK